MLILRLAILSLLSALFLAAQDDPALAVAKALDHALPKLKTLAGDARLRAPPDPAARIRQQPASDVAALAFNLAAEASESDGREALQDVADTIVESIRKSPPQYVAANMYTTLASLARYGRLVVSLDDPKYAAAMSQLDA